MSLVKTKAALRMLKGFGRAVNRVNRRRCGCSGTPCSGDLPELMVR
jgi:hypothetical protein